MTIRKKLLLLLVFPLLVILSFAGVTVFNLYTAQQEAIQISELVELSTMSGALIHEIQKERGMSVGYIGSKGGAFREELKKQRQLVDEKVDGLKSKVDEVPERFFSDKLRLTLSEVYAELEKVPGVRKQVNDLAIPAGGAAGFYTGINKKLIKGVAGFSALTRNTEITLRITGYSLFLSGKDYAGIERAMLSAAFGADRFAPPIFDKYVNARASQEEDFRKFALYASDESIALYEGYAGGDAFAEVNRLRAIADSKISTGGFGVDPTYWFSAKTVKIDQLKEVEDYLAQDIITLAEGQHKQTSTTIKFWSIGLICMFVIVVLSGRNIIYSIIQPMERLLESAVNMAVGKAELKPQDEINDELESVTFMFHSMMDNISESMERMQQEKELADEAVKKAGLLQERTQESEKELKTSVHKMLMALEAFADGDLSTELPEHINPEINRLYTGYNVALAKVRSLIVQLKHVIEQTNSLTARTNEIGARIAEGTNALSSRSSDAASTTTEMAESITSNAKLASSTSEMSNQSGQAAEKGIKIVEETVHRIKAIADAVNRCVQVIDKLGQSSKEITGVVSVIEDIAEQTNLLALNAAIEAARAGESGRGFAVVAEEVRNLSERTKDSTRQIESLVKALKEDTINAVNVMQEGQTFANEGLELADDAYRALQGIGENVQTMVQVITRIAASIEEEANRSNQAALIMRDIDGDAQKTSENVEHVVDSLKQLDVLSGEVSNLVEIFNVGTTGQPEEMAV